MGFLVFIILFIEFLIFGLLVGGGITCFIPNKKKETTPVLGVFLIGCGSIVGTAILIGLGVV